MITTKPVTEYRIKDLTGKRFHRLVVIGYVKTQKGTAKWLCRCDCGEKTVVFGSALTTDHTKSCGCLSKEKAAKKSTKHGLRYTPEYEVWSAMKKRCANPDNKAYLDYGGRGIRVCKRWRKSFKSFYEDMGPRPSSDHSIDRINNDGDYTPGNCRWATPKQQTGNRRMTKTLTYQGQTKPLAEWAREAGISYAALAGRMRLGWSIERALTQPVKKYSERTD